MAVKRFPLSRLRKRFAIYFALAALLATSGAKAADEGALICPAERAVYRLDSDEGPLEVGFIPSRGRASIASDLYLYLTTLQRTYWFSFSVSNGYSGMTLVPVSDPRAEAARENGPTLLLETRRMDEGLINEVLVSLRFYALDEKLGFLFDPPAVGLAAPPMVMMPEIGLTLWYEPQALTEDRSADRDPVPRGIFRLTRCLAEARPAAYP